MPLFYLKTSSSWAMPPNGTRKHKPRLSNSIRPISFEKDREWNLRRLKRWRT